MNDKPIAGNRYFLSYGHSELDPEFQNLVEQQYEENNQKGFFQLEQVFIF
jgi:hypothetical protein